MNQQNRTRDVQLVIRVTPREREVIRDKMSKCGSRNLSQYARKMLIDGEVTNVDLSTYHALANEVNKVGTNINQIARVANQTNNIYAPQVIKLQGYMDEIWQLLKSSLSELQSASR